MLDGQKTYGAASDGISEGHDTDLARRLRRNGGCESEQRAQSDDQRPELCHRNSGNEQASP